MCLILDNVIHQSGSVLKVQKAAEEFIKSNLQKEGFQFVRDNGQKLVVKAPSGAKQAIFIQGFDRTKDQSIKIHTREFNHKFRPNVWIALVVFFPDTQPIDYLIPTTVFEHPDNYLFLHHDISSMNDYYSNVEIKVFTKGVEKLSEYAFAYQIENLK
ncbi:MAG: hypothetical protein Roseis2KO_32880 [Roseivirga sp.]